MGLRFAAFDRVRHLLHLRDFIKEPFVLALMIVAFAQTQDTVEVANDELRATWRELRPVVERKLRDGVRQLSGQRLMDGVTTKTVRIDALDLSDAPRLSIYPLPATVRQFLELRLPAGGGWRVRIAVPLAIDHFWDTTIYFDVHGLHATSRVEIDRSDPEAPVWKDAEILDLGYGLNLDSSSEILDILLDVGIDPFLGLIRCLLDDVFGVGLESSASEVLRQLFLRIAARPNAIHGLGAPPVEFLQDCTDFEARALEIDRFFQDHFLPEGVDTVVYPYFKGYPSDPRVRGGTVSKYLPCEDSAILTGHYLASLAFRYQTTPRRDGATREELRDRAWKILVGLDRLSRICDEQGLLARVAIPVPGGAGPGSFPDTVEGRSLRLMFEHLAFEGIFEKVVDSQRYYYLGRVSRDQYIGVLFGLVNAYTLFDTFADRRIREGAQRIFTRLVRYLLRHRWVVYQSKDPMVSTPAETRVQPGDVSVAFSGLFHHQLSILQAARVVDPIAFGSDFERMAPLSELAWLPIWADTFEPLHDYFKFNLDYASLTTLMRFETDPKRWRDYNRARRILHRVVGHHQNAHFNVCEMSLVPERLRDRLSASDVKGLVTRPRVAETKELLRRWLLRPVRNFHVDLDPMPPGWREDLWLRRVDNERTVKYHPLMTGDAVGGSLADPDTVIRVARFPIPVEQRRPAQFLWEKHPFELRGGGDPSQGLSGIDYLLPYWMGRYFGLSFEVPATGKESTPCRELRSSR